MSGQHHIERQLPLNIALRDEATLDNFLVSPGSGPLMQAVQGQLPQGEQVVYLYGPADTGKSHLLQGACHLAGAEAAYLPLAELEGYSPDDVLQGMESLRLVCLDDIDAVMGNEDWEMALFNFFNRARQENCHLLISANAAPRVLTMELADLRSRLSWGEVYSVTVADDEILKEILIFRAGRRGLQLSHDVANYIVNRAPRRLNQLLSVLEQLDAASLAEQRSLSIPFVKQVLHW